MEYNILLETFPSKGYHFLRNGDVSDHSLFKVLPELLKIYKRKKYVFSWDGNWGLFSCCFDLFLMGTLPVGGVLGF